MNQESLINQPKEKVEDEILLLRETAAMNSSSSPSFFDEHGTGANADRFSHLHLYNHHPCASCGCNGFPLSSLSSGSHKRLASESPSSGHEPKPKKPNQNDDNNNFLSEFSKIPLSPQPEETRPFLRRCVSDITNPPSAPVVEEPPHSPQPNPEIQCPGTPVSNAIASAKLPPRPPTLKRSVSDPIPSPVKTVSSSCESPDTEWLRKMRNCTREMNRKWDELLGPEEDSENAETNRITDNNPENNNNNCTTDSGNYDAMANSEEGFIEAVRVEKKGEALILHFKCPCGVGYQIVLLGGYCYYKIM